VEDIHIVGMNCGASTVIREFVQKPHELHAVFVHCAKPHAAPCGFRLPINYVKTRISVL
jgi:hypothetical protein